MRVARLFFICLLGFSCLLVPGRPGGAAPAEMQLGYNGGSNNHPHNLSSLSGSDVHAPAGGEDEICIFCHTPHGASASAAPLWNRHDPGGSFPLYGNGGNVLEIESIPEAKYTNSDPGIQYPNGSTRLCMSCHDGVNADLGTVLNGGDLASGLEMTPEGVVDLSVSHPVSFVYDNAVRTALIGRAGHGDFLLPPANWLDGERRMQCTTCHDPHVDTRDGTYALPMWANYSGVENNDYSSTCNTCHGAGAYGGFPGNPGSGHTNSFP